MYKYKIIKPELLRFFTFFENIVFLHPFLDRQLQQFPFAFSNSRLDFPGIPDFPSRVIPPSLINFVQTYRRFIAH